MTFLRFLLVLSFLHCYLAQSQEKKVVTIIGKDAVLSCPWIWTYEPDLAVIIHLNGKRIGFWKGGKFKQLASPFVTNRGVAIEPKSEDQSINFKITVPKVTLTDDSMDLKCEAFGMDGMGNSKGAYQAVLRVIDPPKIITEFATKQNKLRGSEKSVEVDCRASGNPKPIVTWSKDGKKIETQAVEGTQRLILKAPISDDADGTYVCTAKLPAEFAKVPGVEEARRELRFSVYYKPKLTFEKKMVHTDLGTRETLKIEASGNPRPDVSCEVLTLPEPKLVRFDPQPGHKVTYEVTLQSVRPADIRQYNCEASNDVGVVKDAVTLTLAPSTPKILSSNSTIYSDYYELHWEVKSKAPISNVTVEVHVKNNKKPGNSTKVRTEVFQLSKDSRSFRHHIANLTHDTLHEVRLQACNSRACSPQKAVAAFKTQSYDGTNTVNPEILVKAITEAPVGASKEGFFKSCSKCAGGSQGGMASSVAPTLSPILLGFLAVWAQQNGGR